METQNFLEYIDVFLSNRKYDLANRFYKEMQQQIRHNSTSATLGVIFNIYDLEHQQKEPHFLENFSSIVEIEECYERLKFYLRRLDFDIPTNDEEFLDFILNNQISNSALLMVIKTSTIHPVETTNKAAMILSENNQLLSAVRLLKCAFQNSKDDTTLFNFALVLWKCGSFDDAQLILNQIVSPNDDVRLLRKLINEKVNYYEQS